MLNRETGVKPVLSRSCNAELVLKSHAFLYLYAEERFILFQGQKLLNKCRNNMGNGCG